MGTVEQSSLKAKFIWGLAVGLLCFTRCFAQTLNLPARSAGAPTGSQFAGIIWSMSLTDRENWIYSQVTNGNVPNFLRTLVPVNVSANINGTNLTGTYYVTPDYVALGTDADYFLEPMTPLLAQRLCDTLGCTLPTRKMVNQIWTNAAVKMTPQPIPPSAEMITVPVFADHNTMVLAQRQTFTNSFPLGALVSGDKKDVIISTKIYTNFSGPTQPVVIYGWHYPSGSPIQPLYNGHEQTYADYSHGIRLVQNAFTLNGGPSTITNALTNPSLAKLLSDEGTAEGTSTNGEIKVPRYPALSVAAVAPTIFTQPRSQTTLPGFSVTFQAQAAGQPPLAYRWLSNGIAIAGATNSSLSISNVQSGNAGNYSVIVTNTVGSTTSRVALLRVNTSVHPILFADSFDTNSSANWNVFWGAANGVPDYTVDWAYNHGTTMYTFNGSGTWIPPAPNSPDGSTRAVRFTVNNNDTNGSIAGANIYPIGQSFTGNFTLKFDMWINYPGDAGGTGTGVTGSTEHGIFGINHLGTEVNWAAPSGSSSDGIWFGVDGEGGTTRDYRTYVGNPSGPPIELTTAASGLIATDSVSTVYQTLFPGSRFETAGAPGKNWVEGELRQTSNTITWLLNGTVVGQRTNTSSYTSGNIMLGFMDTFPSIASPTQNAFILFDNVRVEDLSAPALQPPVISSQPQSQNVSAGTNASFAVGATGSVPLSYQWRKNGNNIAGATNSSLTISSAQPSDAGAYDVFVSNPAGIATSAGAALSVDVPPVQFLSVTVTNGQAQMLFSGVPGEDYLIEASTNLADWKVISVLTASNAPFLFIDPDATNYSARYYRAVQSATQLLTDFESFAPGSTVLFENPSYSGSTSNFLSASSNYAYVTNVFPAGNSSTRVLCAAWDFKTGTINPWLRLTSNAAADVPNPTICTNQVLQFEAYSDRDLYVVIGFRETSTSAPIGADGGTTGTIEWIGGTTDNTTSPPKGRLLTAGQWTTLSFFIPYEPVKGFTGNGILETTNCKGVIEHLALVPAAGLGIYNLWLDNFRVTDLIP